MKFTPGPWTVLPGVPGDRDPWILHDGCKVATVDTSCPDPGELEANANLISSAPDLYEALKALNTWFSEAFDKCDFGHYKRGVHEKFDAASKALAKARGEA